MKVLGVDLSAQPAKTALCVLTGSGDSWEVDDVVPSADDEEILRHMTAASWTGIDAPFGWPAEFVSLMADLADTKGWTASAGHSSYDWGKLRLRDTDREVIKATANADLRSCRPLSVSADSIGVVAFRAARLLHRFGAKEGIDWTFDRSGADPQDTHHVLEVYPAATLSLLRTRANGTRSYKDGDGRVLREDYRDRIANDAGLTIDFGAYGDAVVKTDHAFDAFVSAITAALGSSARTRAIPSEHEAAARAEGWIRLPEAPEPGDPS